jgi:paired amphipathic helix protein Sin3a
MSYSLFDPSRPSVSSEEVDLFDRIKKHIGNKPSYEEFLKLLNLYTQEIVDMDILVAQVKGFLGNNKELMDTFKDTIGYEPKQPPIERPTVSAAKPDLNKCDAVKDSPSYRTVSKDWQHQPCSGRDQMCWEVLNDEYVSHPIWASEDSGFVASKKNQYEEALHRCEEERYEYDLNIEANLNTIALLKPIAERIERMSFEEQQIMRLKPGLGGPTVSIYERIIRKIYDDERGTEIIEMLYQKPANVVPIVLKRLELKDKEWRKAQRDWNKIWRDIDTKNFYRSLDYQGNLFKSNDRKAMQNRALIAEIETLQKEKPTELVQFQFEFKDDTIFRDIARLICSFMDRQNGFTKVDKQKVRNFLRSFVPIFFHVKDTLPKETCIEEYQQEDANEHDDEDNSNNKNKSNSEESDSVSSNSVSPRNRATSEDSHGRLLRGIIKRNANNTTASVSATATATTAETSVQDEIVVADDVIMDEANDNLDLFAVAAAATAPDIINQKRTYSFFCNSQYYCLFRFYLTIYERLYKMKLISNDNETESIGKKFNQTAVELDLVPNRFEDINLSKGYYHALMEMFDHYFEGEIDQPTFEENVRYVFGTEAYLMFTIDKTVQSLIKQVCHKFVS